ncbi:MAG: hypothetical protein RBU37_03390 [Myxococcota bacterium]|nr:hypothetical protein [Myxococcota bacterium]
MSPYLSRLVAPLQTESLTLPKLDSFPGGPVLAEYRLCTDPACPCHGAALTLRAEGDCTALQLDFSLARNEDKEYIAIPEAQHLEHDPALDLLQSWKQHFLTEEQLARFIATVSQARQTRAQRRASRVHSPQTPFLGKTGPESDAVLDALQVQLEALLEHDPAPGLSALLDLIEANALHDAIPLLLEGSALLPDESEEQSRLLDTLERFGRAILDPAIVLASDPHQAAEVRLHALTLIAYWYPDEARLDPLLENALETQPWNAELLIYPHSPRQHLDLLHSQFARFATLFPSPYVRQTLRSLGRALEELDALTREQRKILHRLPFPDDDD